jgi:hypothetical protein
MNTTSASCTEDDRRPEIMYLSIELIQDLDGLRRIGLGEESLHGNSGDENVSHAPSVASRVSSTAKLTPPCRRLKSSRIRSIRARASHLAS